MPIADLTDLVLPPRFTTESWDRKKWAEACRKLDVELPHDLKNYVKFFGTGTFFDGNRLVVRVFNPVSPSYVNQVQDFRFMLEGFKIGEGDEYIPHNIFPVSPGLLAWGADDRGNQFYWLTQGEAAEWPIVIRTKGNEYESFQGPITRFLGAVFSRNIEAAIWPLPFFSDPKEVSFKPDPSVPDAATEPKSIFDLYVANGNKAGFRVYTPYSQKGLNYLIKSIGGRTEGPLPQASKESGSSLIDADLYYNDQIRQPGAKISGPELQIYYEFHT